MPHRLSPALIALLIATLISIFSALIAVSQEAAPPDEMTQVRELGRQAALARITDPGHGAITVSEGDVTLIGNSAFGIAVVRAPDGLHTAPQLVLFAAQRDAAGLWQAAPEGTPRFTDLLRAAPDGLLPAAAESLLVNPPDSAQSGNSAANLSLPFANGETLLVNGPHSGATVTFPLPAVDISSVIGGTGVVRAAADGVVWRSAACPNYVRVDHDATWGTGYYHITSETVSNGQAIARGTVVGTQGTAVGCGGFATIPHVHFSLLRNGIESEIHGHNIGGYMVERHSRPYEGCLIRLRDNTRWCSGQLVAAEATTGGGATDITTTWLFNHHLVGFTAGAGMTHNGFSSENGAALWRIDAADGRIISPTFSVAAPATSAIVSIEMATRNGTCARIYFRRTIDAGFDDTRRVQLNVIPDGVARDYSVNMSQNANWNGTIAQLAIAPGCTPNATLDDRVITLRRVQINRLPAANTNLLTNPTFASCLNGWNYGLDQATNTCGGSQLRTGRRANTFGFYSLFQDLRTAAVRGMPFEVTLSLANTHASLAHRVTVGLRDPDSLSNALLCTFTLPPNTPYGTYTVRGNVPIGWNETRFELGLLTLTTTADIMVKTVSVQYQPSATFNALECQPAGSADPLPTPDPTVLYGSVTLQGRPSPPDPAWAVPVRVVVRRTADSVVLFDNTVSASQSGEYTISGLAPGSAQVWVKQATMLAAVQTVTFTGGPNVIDSLLLRAGDANNDNVVSISDFSLLAAAFGSTQGAGNYDARADFNGDGSITVSDFSLLAANFGTSGPAS